MKVLVLVIAAYLCSLLLLFLVAGAIAAYRARVGRRTARMLRRVDNLSRLFAIAAGIAAILIVAGHAGPTPRWAVIVTGYASPPLVAFILVAGKSFVEILARGSSSTVWRYQRFAALTGYLLFGQRLPYFSAAILAPVDSLAGIALHLFAAFALGWVVRWLVVEWIADVRPFPDARLAVEVRAVARGAGIRLRGILSVATEPGQPVNAVAATTSGYVFVAEGLWKGLDREEVRAVLLHEVGHLGQGFLNTVRNLGMLGWPVVIFLIRAFALRETGIVSPDAAFLILTITGVVGSATAYRIVSRSEIRADRFAERWAAPGALASALTKLQGSPIREEEDAVWSEILGP